MNALGIAAFVGAGQDDLRGYLIGMSPFSFYEIMAELYIMILIYTNFYLCRVTFSFLPLSPSVS